MLLAVKRVKTFTLGDQLPAIKWKLLPSTLTTSPFGVDPDINSSDTSSSTDVSDVQILNVPILANLRCK